MGDRWGGEHGLHEISGEDLFTSTSAKMLFEGFASNSRLYQLKFLNQQNFSLCLQIMLFMIYARWQVAIQ